MQKSWGKYRNVNYIDIHHSISGQQNIHEIFQEIFNKTIVKNDFYLFERKETFNHGIDCMELDLSNFASIHEFCNKLTSKERKLDFLVCNAGIGWNSDHPVITSDGQVA